MDQIDIEFPRLRKLSEARAARLARQNVWIERQHHNNKRPHHHEEKTTDSGEPPSSPHSPTSTSVAKKQPTPSPTSISFDINDNAVHSKYTALCCHVSQLDHEIQTLLTRGTYLAEQTLLDAEAEHHSTYGLTTTKTITLGGTVDTIDTASNNNSSTATATAAATAILPTTAAAESAAATVILNMAYRSVQVTELQSKRAVQTLRRHLQHWQHSHRLRRSIRKHLTEQQPLEQPKAFTSFFRLSKEDYRVLWLTVHVRVGKGSFHPEEIFRREGKHRMAKEYREHRILRKCLGYWMVKTSCFTAGSQSTTVPCDRPK